ncbi:MAG TPA: flavodoxin domain-containing protein [Candidatus Dormibacteraeota bacterium]|jgi:flavorubredoxin|nr:flavodoxin domain-containing protein [Candidatus Dormibacteraeota bacterium]
MNESEGSERAIVIFDSKFGNTGDIAKSLAGGLQRAGLRVDCLNMRDVKLETLGEYDLIAVGAPTQAFSASKPMKDFLQKLEGNRILAKKLGFAFDTKLGSRLSGSASKFIESRLSKLGMRIVRPRQSAIVKGSEGPLKEGEPELFNRLGFEIGTEMLKTSGENLGDKRQ